MNVRLVFRLAAFGAIVGLLNLVLQIGLLLLVGLVPLVGLVVLVAGPTMLQSVIHRLEGAVGNVRSVLYGQDFAPSTLALPQRCEEALLRLLVPTTREDADLEIHGSLHVGDSVLELFF